MAKEKKKVSNVNNKRISKKIGYLLCALQTIATLVFMYALNTLNMLPMKYMGAIAAILFVVLIVCSLGAKISKKKALTVKVVSALITVMLCIGSFYLVKAILALEKISSIDVKLDNMVVAVLVDNPAETILDAAEYTFAVETSNGEIGEYATIIIEEIESTVENEIKTKEYDSLYDQIDALQNGEVDAIIYNEAYLAIIEDDDPEFSETIKVIFEHGIEVEIEKNEEVELIEVESQAYTVYISGIDVYGSITKTSRSDVNILATVNPDTEQILLVTTPRDYYVTLPGVSGDSKDKLTHAGLYGVDVSMDTLEELYGVNVDFYARVNFTSLINMVDALGGITVYSNQSFWTTKHDGVSYYVEEGYNDFNGTEALYFARERMNISGGDYQRGENQEEIIKAMIEKATSPAIITGAYEILDSISDNLDTSMSTEQIQSLIKTQIDDGTEWDIIMMSAEGESGSAACYSSGSQLLSVVYPVDESVEEISAAIEAIYNGEILVEEEEE